MLLGLERLFIIKILELLEEYYILHCMLRYFQNGNQVVLLHLYCIFNIASYRIIEGIDRPLTTTLNSVILIRSYLILSFLSVMTTTQTGTPPRLCGTPPWPASSWTTSSLGLSSCTGSSFTKIGWFTVNKNPI